MPTQQQSRVLLQPRAFSPRSLSDLALWLNADQIGGVDGDAVSTWPDSSGNARDATAATTKRPTLKKSILNGHAVARFNGANGMLTPTIDLTGTSAVTVFIVGTAAAGSDQIWLEMSTNYGSVTDSFVIYRTSTNLPEADIRGNTGINAFNNGNAATNGRIVTTRAEVVTAILDKSSVQTAPIAAASPYRETMLFIDGLQANGSNAWTSGLIANNTNAYGNKAFYIGARNQASLFLTGDIAEIIMYSSALTPTNRALVERYLIQKYARQYTTGTLACVGDSMTAGVNATSHYPSQLAALLVTDGFSWNVGNFGMNGWSLDNMSNFGMAPLITPYAGIDGGKSVALVWGGTNDMAGSVGNQSAATAYTRLQTLCATLRGAGYKVGVLTCLARTDASAGGSFETRRQAYNTSIRGGWATFADALIDLSTEVRLDDGTGTLPVAVDSGDLVHLNNTGQGYVAALAKTAVEAL